MARFSVVIPTLQRSPMMRPLVEMYAAHPLVGEVILINNAPESLAFDSEKVRVLQQAENIYVNPAWNLGAREAREELLLISNDDLSFAPSVVDFLHREVQREDVGIIGPATSCLNGREGRLHSRFMGDCLRGFGTLMAMRTEDYHVIPDGPLILSGDEWLFWTHPRRNHVLLGARIETPMAATAGSPEFRERRAADTRWWVEQWDSLVDTRDWHRSARRQNIGRNLRRAVRQRARSLKERG